MCDRTTHEKEKTTVTASNVNEKPKKCLLSQIFYKNIKTRGVTFLVFQKFRNTNWGAAPKIAEARRHGRGLKVAE